MAASPDFCLTCSLTPTNTTHPPSCGRGAAHWRPACAAWQARPPALRAHRAVRLCSRRRAQHPPSLPPCRGLGCTVGSGKAACQREQVGRGRPLSCGCRTGATGGGGTPEGRGGAAGGGHDVHAVVPCVREHSAGRASAPRLRAGLRGLSAGRRAGAGLLYIPANSQSALGASTATSTCAPARFCPLPRTTTQRGPVCHADRVPEGRGMWLAAVPRHGQRCRAEPAGAAVPLSSAAGACHAPTRRCPLSYQSYRSASSLQLQPAKGRAFCLLQSKSTAKAWTPLHCLQVQ